MRVGRHAVLVRCDAANLGNLNGHFLAWQDPAFARLGALRQLDLKRPDGWYGSQPLFELGEAKTSVLVAAAKIAGTKLINQIGTILMIRANAAFPSILQAAGSFGPAVDRAYSTLTQG